MPGEIPGQPMAAPASPAPQEAPDQQAGQEAVLQAIETIGAFGQAQAQQGNPKIMEILQMLIQAISGGGEAPADRGQIPENNPSGSSPVI